MAGVFNKALHISKPLLWWLLGTNSSTYRSRHAIDHYLHAIVPILDRPLTEEERQPRMYLTSRDRGAARRILREVGASPAKTLITMHVGGEGFNGRKRWSTKRFTQVANSLVEKFGAHILLLGGKTDVTLCEEVAARIPRNCTILAGKTSLKQTAALIEASTLFIGNDSCPLHIAAAVGTPAVGIYGPSNHEQFRPIGKHGYQQRIINSNLPCSPCFHFIGNDAPWVPNTCYSFACLKSVTADQVISAAEDLLNSEQLD